MDKPKKHEDVLRAALGFDEDDLAANREGRLSDRQTAKFKRDQRKYTIATAVTALLALMFVLFIGMTNSPVSHLLNGLGSLILGLIALMMVQPAVRNTLALRRKTAAAAEGRIRLDMQGEGQAANAFYLFVDDRRFTVKKPVFLSFKNGDPYRIYYAPATKQILSAEWLRDDSPFVNAPPARRERPLAVELEGDESRDDNPLFGDDGELRADARR
jgi:hypothetical protein